MKKDYVNPDIQVVSIELGSVLMASSMEENTSAVQFQNLEDGGDFIW